MVTHSQRHQCSSSVVDLAQYTNSFTWSQKARRFTWHIVWLFLFRPSPKLFFRWRRLLLRMFGARVASTAIVHPSCRVWDPNNLTMGAHSSLGPFVDCYCVDAISIDANGTVSQYSYLCSGTHDISDPTMRLVTAPIRIHSGAWVCARAFIGPGVTVGEGAVVGACAVVVKDVEAWTVVVGNPARVVKQRRIQVI